MVFSKKTFIYNTQKLMNLLVISDLHVGAKARAQDFSTNIEDMCCRNTPDYINDFECLVNSENLDVTHILVAGDITQTAAYEEFELAAKNIKKIADILEVDVQNIFFIPGNHDSSWVDEKSSLARNEPVNLTISKKYMNIVSHPFFSELLQNAVHNHMFEAPFGSIWINDHLVVVGINSAARDGASKDVHHGAVNIDDIKQLETKLINCDLKDKVKILLTHHHPKNYTDRTFPDNDFSIMQNAEAFLRFATENEFDVIVHGHKHIPRFDIHSDYQNYPIVALSAGSFSASLKDYHNGVANFFHIIQFEGQCPQNFNRLGKITSWAYFDNNKWICADKNRDYIAHEEYFGDVRNRKVLKEHFRREISSVLAQKNMFRWKKHLEEKPQMKYCNLTLRELALTEVCSEEGWEYVPVHGHSNDFLIMPEGK
ncbi:metallophosphoesterase [Pseudoalteromonas fuliginea]|uniref:metallophosphoesterase family protein n=1 Tax=Pseudoalteromonas fuliginea TaxID=1872678 RepID=UPI00316E5AFE